MSADQEAKEKDDELEDDERNQSRSTSHHELTTRDSDDDHLVDEEEEEEDEPRLKYTKLTASLASVYRNGDATSTFLVGGDKMVRGWREYGPVHAKNCLNRLQAHTMAT